MARKLAEHQKALALLRQGQAAPDVARKVGVTLPTVRRWGREAGILSPKSSPSEPFIPPPDEIREQCDRLRERHCAEQPRHEGSVHGRCLYLHRR